MLEGNRDVVNISTGSMVKIRFHLGAFEPFGMGEVTSASTYDRRLTADLPP